MRQRTGFPFQAGCICEERTRNCRVVVCESAVWPSALTFQVEAARLLAGGVSSVNETRVVLITLLPCNLLYSNFETSLPKGQFRFCRRAMSYYRWVVCRLPELSQLEAIPPKKEEVSNRQYPYLVRSFWTISAIKNRLLISFSSIASSLAMLGKSSSSDQNAIFGDSAAHKVRHEGSLFKLS